MENGIILSGVGGTYEIACDSGATARAKARGLFRKEGLCPLLGDRVSVSDEGFIEEIFPRKNSLIRPAAANMDLALFVAALHTPEPSPIVIEKFLLQAGRAGIPAALCFNKSDLREDEEPFLLQAKDAYEKAGIPVFLISAKEEKGLEELLAFLEGKLTVLAGPSGAGKSSLINRLTDAGQEVGELSRKIERGKNTTRHARLLPLRSGSGYVADTPGFTSFYLMEWTLGDLTEAYPDFKPYALRCRFDDCRHLSEPDCAVKEAVEAGELPRLRYEAYCSLYEEIRQNKRED